MPVFKQGEWRFDLRAMDFMDEPPPLRRVNREIREATCVPFLWDAAAAFLTRAFSFWWPIPGKVVVHGGTMSTWIATGKTFDTFT